VTVPKVLGRTSSINVRKVLWTLDELDLAYEREDWGAGFASTKDPTFLALNPNALVPVLLDEHGRCGRATRSAAIWRRERHCCRKTGAPGRSSSSGWTGRRPS
jgi:glutathione S-transferase